MISGNFDFSREQAKGRLRMGTKRGSILHLATTQCRKHGDCENRYNPYHPDQFLGYILLWHGNYIATPKETTIQMRCDSRDGAISFLESYSGCHL